MIAFPRSVAERDVLATAKATVTDTATASCEWPTKESRGRFPGSRQRWPVVVRLRSQRPHKARINERVSHARVATLVCGGGLSRSGGPGFQFWLGTGGGSQGGTSSPPWLPRQLLNAPIKYFCSASLCPALPFFLFVPRLIL